MTERVLFKKLAAEAVIPTYGSDGAAALDLYAIEAGQVGPGLIASVSTGIAFKPPTGTYGRIAPRSGLANKYGAQILGGVIDKDYRGALKVMLTSVLPFAVKPGDRIAQLVLEAYVRAEPTEVQELGETGRGAGGFGSTGR